MDLDFLDFGEKPEPKLRAVKNKYTEVKIPIDISRELMGIFGELAGHDDIIPNYNGNFERTLRTLKYGQVEIPERIFSGDNLGELIEQVIASESEEYHTEKVSYIGACVSSGVFYLKLLSSVEEVTLRRKNSYDFAEYYKAEDYCGVAHYVPDKGWQMQDERHINRLIGIAENYRKTGKRNDE